MKKKSINSTPFSWGNGTEILSYEIKSSVQQLRQCLANEGLMAIHNHGSHTVFFNPSVRNWAKHVHKKECHGFTEKTCCSKYRNSLQS